MIEMTCAHAREIFDNICMKIDGKKASAWTSQLDPFAELEDYDAWGQHANNASSESSRTDAFLFGYTLLTGGSIPMRGMQFTDGYVRPDVWVVGSLVKSNRLVVDETAKMLVVTANGWARIAKLTTHLSAPE